MTTGWPSRSDSQLPTMRARMSFGPPGRAMVQAFAHVLDIWLKENSKVVSTQDGVAFAQMREFYLGAPAASFTVSVWGAEKGDDARDEKTNPERDQAKQSDTVPPRGWEVWRGGFFETDQYGRKTFKPGTCATNASRLCECCAPLLRPPPVCIRKTIGIFTPPPTSL